MNDSSKNLVEETPGNSKKRSKKSKKKPRMKAKARLKLLERFKTEKQEKREKVIKYLKDWANRDESEWKFNKSMQIWLMKNWYKPDELDTKDYETFMEYIARVEDNAVARRKLVSRALLLLEDPSSSDAVKDRSRSLIQLL